MKIESCRFFNAEARSKINLSEYMKTNLEQTDSIIKHFSKLRPDKLDKYLQAFQKRLSDVIRDSRFNTGLSDLESIGQNLTILNKYPELEKVIGNFILELLELPEGLDSAEEEIEIRYFNIRKASGYLSYYRVKAIEDIFGKDEATKLYKEIIKYLIEEQKEHNPPEIPEDPRKETRTASRERVTKQYRELGVGDFTIAIFDDYKELYKFDKCVVHEVLKDLKDPDIAFLSSCYSRDHPSYNEGQIIHMRRTQTLHHGDFCDELYWNDVVHPNAEQPSLEFVKKLGKEDPNKLIEEYTRGI